MRRFKTNIGPKVGYPRGTCFPGMASCRNERNQERQSNGRNSQHQH